MTISVIVNLHNEGLMAYPCLQSVINSCSKFYQVTSKSSEIILILDHPNELTLEITNNKVFKSFKRYIIDEKDLSSSRNFGVSKASGRYVAFIDGDDLWGDDWLWRSYQTYETFNQPVVLHPEMNYIFDQDYHIFWHTDMDDETFDLDYLGIANYWTALSFSEKVIYERIPFIKNNIREGFGFEDWNWNCRTIESGIIHKIVRNTCHFIRRKAKGSMLSETHVNSCLLTPVTLFKSKIHKKEPL